MTAEPAALPEPPQGGTRTGSEAAQPPTGTADSRGATSTPTGSRHDGLVPPLPRTDPDPLVTPEQAVATSAGQSLPSGLRLDGVRIAVVNWRDPWQQAGGGAEEYAWQISRQLLLRGAQVTFVTSREPGQSATETRHGVRFVRTGGKYTRYPLILAWLARHRRSFDVVIDAMNGIPFFSPLVMPAKVPVILVVHHVHDQQFFVWFSSAVARFGRMLEGPASRWVYRGRSVIAVSPSTARVLREKLAWRGPIYVVPNGSPAVQPVNVAMRPADGDPAIVVVGRLVVHKRVDELIDIAVRLRESWPHLKLHIVGRGPDEGAIRDRIEAEDLSEFVRLHGFLPEPDKNTLIATSRLHLSASRFEGWGLSVVEAAALGVPTVACDVDGLRDAVRDGITGWLAASGEDYGDVADRALKELGDAVRRAEVRTACTQWARTFTWSASGDRFTDLITAELVQAAAPRPSWWARVLARLTGGGKPAEGRWRHRLGGPALAVRYLDGNEERGIVVENGDEVDLTATIGADRIVEIRPATPAEVLLGRIGGNS